MQAAVLQYDPTYLEVEANLNEAERLLKDIVADLIVLPELFASGYFFQSRDDLELVAEPAAGGKTCDRLIGWAKQRGAVIVAGIPEIAEGSFYNSAVVVGPEGLMGVYRKVHLFHREKSLFTPGDRGFSVLDVRTRAGSEYRLGVMICFDWYYPESARILAIRGADVIAHPSNLVRSDCPRAMPIRALENHVFTITANRIGRETAHGEELKFIGRSVVCDPLGGTMFSAPAEDAVVGVVEFDPHAARDRRITPFNDLLLDRRPETYNELVSGTV